MNSRRTLYNYFRDYDPATGRYVQSDPIGLYGGIKEQLLALWHACKLAAGSWWSRTGSRANGDYIPTTGTRPDLHDLMDATAAGIGGKYPTWPAWRRAINRMPYTPGGTLYGGASAAMNACECSQ